MQNLMEEKKCNSCGGKGWRFTKCKSEFIACSRCNATGMAYDEVARIIEDAIMPYRKPLGTYPEAC